ncbi:MAG: hypothetical protein KF862_16195 [Chitinophagaceae bacterium]|jgi:hypothetical protein|nr:hypothetical protein [Chitinophagaceae bacterium]
MGRDAQIRDKPQLPKRLFWDFKYEQIDWVAGYLTVIARVIERGSKEEWEEVIRFYGRDQVFHALKYEIKFLADYAIEEVCAYFSIPKENLLCYTRKQSRPGHWI